MNNFSFKHKSFNNNVESILFSPLDEESFKNQFDEIFVQEQYRDAKYKKNMVVIDVGANMGLSALYLKDYAKKIYALEPSKEHFQALLKNVAPYKNIVPLNIGISAITAEDSLVSNGPSNLAESLFGEGTTKEKANFIRLDDFFRQYNIVHVDLLKVDTEGAEYVIFPSEGFRNVASKIDRIVGEAHIMKNMFPEFVPLMLSEAGFKTRFLPLKNIFKTLTFTELNTGKKMEWKAYYNTLFVAER